MTVNYLVCNIEGQKHYPILELLPLQGEITNRKLPQGDALGYVLLGFQPVCHIIADNNK